MKDLKKKIYPLCLEWLVYLPSGLFGEVRNMHLGFSSSTTSAMRSTFKLKSGFLGTEKQTRPTRLRLYIYILREENRRE